MRPIINPGLRRLWRDHATLQLGVDAGHAIVLSGLGAAASGVLDLLDGTRTRAQLLAETTAAGRELITLLEAEGVLDDASADPAGSTSLPALEHGRLGPDRASLSLLAAGPAGARVALRRRQAAIVRVRGAGRVGAHVATLLAAAGVGSVIVDDAGVARPSDAAPGGLRLDDIGRPRSVAAGRAIARACRPAVSRRRAATPVRPDLVVITPTGPPVADIDEAADLEQARLPHLIAGVRETTGIIGPMVLPGRSACLGCQHRHRTDRDPAWPLLVAQLTRRPEVGIDPCDVTLAALVAAVTAMQALALLDAALGANGDRRGGPQRSPEDSRAASVTDGTAAAGPTMFPTAALPASVGGTLELALPSWRIRRRSWPVHPDCSCAAAAGIPKPGGPG
ncbi:MAG: ThiF family adenylyltransferase [Frankia sp.]